MESLRLLHCLTHSTLGGGQELVYTLIEALRRPGIDIGVVLPADGVYVGRFRSLGIPVYEAPMDSIGLPGIPAFRRAIASFEPTAVHSHGKGAGLYARTLAGGVPRVHSYHGFFPPAGRVQRRLYLQAERSLLRRTNAVVAVSDGEAAELRRIFPEHASKVVSIPNVIDRNRVLAASCAALEDGVREFVARRPDGVIVTMVARDDPAKNYPLALAACRQALAARSELAVIFVGVGPGSPVESLRQDFPDRFLAVPRLDSVSPVIRASNIVLLTSVKEGGRPLVLQEALALGKPVVGTDVPGIRETVRNGENGILCALEPSSVAAGIVRLASSAEERAAMGDRGARDAAQQSLGIWAAKYMEVYALAGGRSGAPRRVA